jgi:pyridinium-3,5-bisthiocarboxylic acid mononucleotide nickel chelatase
MNMIAFFDPFSGISGDMTLGSLIDAGLDVLELEKGLNTISELRGQWSLRHRKVHKGTGSISATKVDIESVFNHEPLPPPTSSSSHSHSHGGYSHGD